MGPKSRCGCCTRRVTASVLIFFGVLFIVLGVLGRCKWKGLFDDQVKQQTQMIEGTQSYDNWLQPPVSPYLNLYLYSYQNAEAIASGAKPNVTEHGPYAYREIRVNVVVENSTDEITYLQNYSYVFDPQKSCAGCTEEDYVVTPNMGVLTFFAQLKDMPTWEKAIAEGYLVPKDTPLFYNLTVREMVWGYNSTFIQTLVKEIDNLPSFIKSIVEKLNPDIANVNPFIQLRYNGTKGAELCGNVTIDTGSKNVADVQKTLRWRGLSTSPHWNGNYSIMLNGTDGTHFAPFTEKSDKLYFFVTDLARSMYAIFDGETSLYDISLYKYTPDEFLFANTTTNPNNKDFCIPVGNCYEAGVLYVGHIQEGAPPVFVSAPHFYQGAEHLWQGIDGLSEPEKSKHATLMGVEPITGILMEGYKRLQINVLVENTGFLLTKNIINGKVFLPLMYVDEAAVIDEENANVFKKQVYVPRTLLSNAQYLMFGLAVLVVGIAIMLFVLAARTGQGDMYNKLDAHESNPPPPTFPAYGNSADNYVPNGGANIYPVITSEGTAPPEPDDDLLSA